MCGQADRQLGPSDSGFQHEPLQNAATYTRLLRPVSTGLVNAEILSYEIRPWHMSQIPAYAALSYTWACEWFGTMSRLISIGEKPFTVGGSCEYALRQVANQDHSGSTWIWVDSICIDQDNLQEKAKQVAMMSSIYAQASVVYACVGPHAHDSEFLLRLCDALIPAGAPTRLQASPNEDEDELEKYFEQQDTRFFEFLQRKRRKGDKGIKSDNEIVLMFHSFSQRRYWSRLWIIQELWLGRKTIVLCGMETLRMTQLIQAANLVEIHCPLGLKKPVVPWSKTFLGSLLETLSRFSPQYIPFNDKSDINEYYTLENKNKDVWTMIRRFKRWNCHDFHDRVHALSGFATWQDVPLQPNYNISKLDLVFQLLSFSEPRPESILPAVHDLVEVIHLELLDPDVANLLKRHSTSPSSIPKRIKIHGRSVTGSLLERPPTSSVYSTSHSRPCQDHALVPDGGVEAHSSDTTLHKSQSDTRDPCKWECGHALPEDHFLHLGVVKNFGFVTRAPNTSPTAFEVVGSSWFTPLIPDGQMTIPSSKFHVDLTLTPEQVVVLTLLDNQYSGRNLDPAFEHLALNFVRPIEFSVELRERYEPEARSFGSSS